MFQRLGVEACRGRGKLGEMQGLPARVIWGRAADADRDGEDLQERGLTRARSLAAADVTRRPRGRAGG